MTQSPRTGEEPALPVPPQGTEASAEQSPVGAPPLEKKRKPSLVLAVVLLAVLLLAGLGTAIFLNATRTTPMEQAYENCFSSKAFTRVLKEGLSDDNGKPVEESDSEESEPDSGGLDSYFEGVLSLEDDGTTLIVNTLGQDDDPLGIGAFAVECVNLDLETPQWVFQSVQQTRSLDGRQTAEWGKYSAQWSYHPDNGLNMIITTK